MKEKEAVLEFFKDEGAELQFIFGPEIINQTFWAFAFSS